MKKLSSMNDVPDFATAGENQAERKQWF